MPVFLPQLSDMGLYTCVATSFSGETSWSAYLDVRGLSQGINDSSPANDFVMTLPGSGLADFHSAPLVFIFFLLGQSQLTS